MAIKQNYLKPSTFNIRKKGNLLVFKFSSKTLFQEQFKNLQRLELTCFENDRTLKITINLYVCRKLSVLSDLFRTLYIVVGSFEPFSVIFVFDIYTHIDRTLTLLLTEPKIVGPIHREIALYCF